MKLAIGALAAAALLLVPNAPARAANQTYVVIAAVDALNQGLQSYTFHMNVAMAMKHFPWLHFHVEGDGVYQRGERYAVHFTKMPFFATQIHDVDLSMLDPSMWPGRYRFYEVGPQNGTTVFALDALHDPTLKSATVGVDQNFGPRWVDSTYTDGTHIHMDVTWSSVSGYTLPSTMSASVDYPRMPLSASADFQDYNIAGATR
jgi:hypothetical protein